MNALEFVRQIAQMQKTQDTDDAIATVNRLIADAQRELESWFAEPPEERETLIAMARERWESDDLEIDDEPGPLSFADEGAWVPAWVWVPFPDDWDR
jgi:hypothetical protein